MHGGVSLLEPQELDGDRHVVVPVDWRVIGKQIRRTVEPLSVQALTGIVALEQSFAVKSGKQTKVRKRDFSRTMIGLPPDGRAVSIEIASQNHKISDAEGSAISDEVRG